MHAMLNGSDYMQAINSKRRLQRIMALLRGGVERQNLLSLKGDLSGRTDTKCSVPLVFIAEHIKPRKCTLLHVAVFCRAPP